MLKVRIIPCLDVHAGRVVKGVNFVDLIDAGDPVRHAVAGHVTPVEVERWAGGASPEPEAPPEAAVPDAGSDDLILLRRIGRNNPLDLDAYVADRGFEALALARELGPEGVIATVTESGLVGRARDPA